MCINTCILGGSGAEFGNISVYHHTHGRGMHPHNTQFFKTSETLPGAISAHIIVLTLGVYNIMQLIIVRLKRGCTLNFTHPTPPQYVHSCIYSVLFHLTDQEEGHFWIGKNWIEDDWNVHI